MTTAIRRKNPLLPSVVFLAAAVCFGEGARTVSTVSTEMDLPGSFTNRIVVDRGTTRFFVLDRRDIRRRDREFTSAGIATPAFVAGPVTTAGLLREIENPLGYGPRSDVFTEPNGMGLRVGHDKASRNGIWARIPDNIVGIGGYTDADDATHAAAALDWGGDEAPRLTALVMASNPDERAPVDEWFPETPGYPGGVLYHQAGGMDVPFSTLFDGDLRLGVSYGISRGDRTPAAGFAHTRAVCLTELFEVHLVSGVCGRDYVTPSGGYPSNRFLGSAAVTLLPGGLVTPTGSYAHTVGRSLPNAVSQERREISLGLRLRTKLFFLRAEKKRTESRSGDGGTMKRDRTEASALYRRKTWSLGADVTVEEGEDSRRTAVFEGELRPKGWELALRGKCAWDPRPAWTGKVSAALSPPGLKAGFSVEMTKAPGPNAEGLRCLRENPFDFFVFSVFWQYRGGI